MLLAHGIRHSRENVALSRGIGNTRALILFGQGDLIHLLHAVQEKFGDLIVDLIDIAAQFNNVFHKFLSVTSWLRDLSPTKPFSSSR